MRPIGRPNISAAGASTVVRRAVVIGNGAPGAESQCLGLVRALGLPHSLYRVARPRGGINEWLRWLPVSLHRRLDRAFNRVLGGETGELSALEADAEQIAALARETYHKEGPLLVVASGRDTVSLASSIKSLSPRNVFVIQIQHPRSHLDRFDLVVTPRHDYHALTPIGQKEIPKFLRPLITPKEPPGGNVVLTMGALHQADSATLKIAATTWNNELAHLPKPLLVVNIGGPMSNCRYGVDLAKELANSLHNVLQGCGSIRVSFSRRTPIEVLNIIIRELGNHPKIYIWDGKDPNPHLGHLAWADAFLITADSVSMLSEACSTGKPVYVIGAERCTWKFSAFHNTLLERGAVRPFTGKEDMSESWSYPPLDDAVVVATRIREALAGQGWTLQS